MRPLVPALYLLAAAAAPVLVTPRPAPPPMSAVLGSAGFGAPLRPLQGFTPLPGLSPAGDPAPQCRAGCTRARAICGDDSECSDQWRQCVSDCSRQPR